MKMIIDYFFMKGFTNRQRLVIVWFTLSLAALVCTVDAPFWAYAIEIASLYFSSRGLRYLPMPDYLKEEGEDDED